MNFSKHIVRLLTDRLIILLFTILILFTATAFGAEIRPFSSDGCSLFPDGTLSERTKWCGCCFSHDQTYWQGGSKTERQTADAALRDCVQEQTGDAVLAETMYLGVRAGGHPALPVWYRWGYGWDYGRGYQPLSAEEKEQVDRQLATYSEQHPLGFCQESEPDNTGRPAEWAVPIPSENLENFYRLDAKVYRSAQPEEAGFAELRARGINNILNLREYHSDADGKPFGLNLMRVKMAAGSITTEEVVEALRFIHNSKGPVLVHCWHGSDRTGMVSAMYRIVFQGWSKERAITELTDGGYGYHAFWYGNIPEFIRAADIEAIRKAVLAPGE
jgi:protein tyrosine phosphatase (PTP) superfamily phosphohydrolase (DUF442 family)